LKNFQWEIYGPNPGILSNMAVINSEAASLNAKSLLEAFRKRKGLIVHVQHVSTNLSHGGIDVSHSNVHASYMAALGAVCATVISSEKIIEQIGA